MTTKKANCSRCVFYEWTTAEKITREDSAMKNRLAWPMKYQSMLSDFHSDVISETCFTAMTGERHGEPAKMDLSMIAVALTRHDFYEF